MGLDLSALEVCDWDVTFRLRVWGYGVVSEDAAEEVIRDLVEPLGQPVTGVTAGDLDGEGSFQTLSGPAQEESFSTTRFVYVRARLEQLPYDVAQAKAKGLAEEVCCFAMTAAGGVGSRPDGLSVSSGGAFEFKRA